MPAPVVVTKDVGGFVSEYQTQTAIYKALGREVRLHECRSACTLALSLPNVCVYPDSVLKFHQAYDPRNRQADLQVSQQLFDSYPAAVQARLGTLTRTYRVLRGSELIELGIRNCNEPRVMVASATPRKTLPSRVRAEPELASQASVFGGLMQNVLAAFGQSGGAPGERREKFAAVPSGAIAKAVPADLLPSAIPLPPARPVDFDEAKDLAAAQESLDANGALAIEAADVPVPPRRAADATLSYSYRLAPPALPKIMSGAQPILPASFTASATLRRS